MRGTLGNIHVQEGAELMPEPIVRPHHLNSVFLFPCAVLLINMNTEEIRDG